MQSLTVQPTVKDGMIVYEDSPLVRAVRLGHALVVDEADKAPTHVTCVLKNLLESGRATLADGRKIVSGKYQLCNLSLVPMVGVWLWFECTLHFPEPDFHS